MGQNAPVRENAPFENQDWQLLGDIILGGLF